MYYTVSSNDTYAKVEFSTFEEIPQNAYSINLENSGLDIDTLPN